MARYDLTQSKSPGLLLNILFAACLPVFILAVFADAWGLAAVVLLLASPLLWLLRNRAAGEELTGLDILGWWLNLLLMACVPVSVALLFRGRPASAAGLILVVGPLLWFAERRVDEAAVSKRHADSLDPDGEQLKDLESKPVRFRIPGELLPRLSARDLSDVPSALRIGSPHDASDEMVRQHLMRLGTLNPRTNFGVVYRVCFLPLLEPGESARFLRFGYVSFRLGSKGEGPGDPPIASWILATNDGVRWHQVDDPVPGMPTGEEDVVVRRRQVRARNQSSFHEGAQMVGPGGISLVPLEVKTRERTNVWLTLYLSNDQETEAFARHLGWVFRGAKMRVTGWGSAPPA